MAKKKTRGICKTVKGQGHGETLKVKYEGTVCYQIS